MTDAARALCSDFYVNHKLGVKMDLPKGRESVLDLFERLRKQFPQMNQLRRFREEVALESPQAEPPHRWVAMRGNTIRSGTVNAAAWDESYALHLSVLELAPFFLNISPLDVDHLELLYGFDMAAQGNHDAIVCQAFYSSSPLAALMELPDAHPIECQPTLGFALGEKAGSELFVEVKTRTGPRGMRPAEPREDPISVYLTIRRFAPLRDVKELPALLKSMAEIGESVVQSHVIPSLLVPLRDAIGSSNSE
ncbi:MAG: hypothetical protein SFZ23_04860 [Planctomycetota bacterium]|nr:hypothetical protein [Planctomycetota bacterium]